MCLGWGEEWGMGAGGSVFTWMTPPPWPPCLKARKSSGRPMALPKGELNGK